MITMTADGETTDADAFLEQVRVHTITIVGMIHRRRLIKKGVGPPPVPPGFGV